MKQWMVEADVLRSFLHRIFRAEGLTQENAEQTADVMMLADLYGIESHGIQRLMYYHQNLKSG